MGVLGKIFRLLIYVAMIVVGSLLNYYVDSPVIVGVVMLGISFSLNRGANAKQQVKPQVSQDTRIAYGARGLEAPRVSNRYPDVMRASGVGVVGKTYCPSCGGQNNSNAKFCAFCGAQLKTPVAPPQIQPGSERYTPQEIMNQIVSLRDYYLSGGIDKQSYLNVLEKSVYIDGWNRRWAVGANSLKWYRYESGSWFNDIPTGTLSIS